MSSRGRGRNRGSNSGGRSNGGISKPIKKNAARSGVKKGVDSTPDPPKIRALKARKAELSLAFKVLGSHQKAALMAVAQKSLDAVTNDPNYHTNLLEFRLVCQGLEERLKTITMKLEERRRHELELAQRVLEYKSYLINQQCKDLKEEAIAKVQERALYVEKMFQVKGEIRDIAFDCEEDGRKVTKLAAPPRIIHPVTFPFSGVHFADEKSHHKPGDNLFEQHPANYWISCTDDKKKKFLAQQASIIEKNRRVAQNEKFGICKSQSTVASSLFNTSSASGIDTEVDEDDLQLDEPIIVPEFIMQDDPIQISELSDDAAELPLDPYGVKIPKKKMRAGMKIRPNNYIVVPRTFDFQDAEGQILEDGSVGIQEIGIRTWSTRKNARNHDYFIGCSANPNPENFYIPQRVGDINSGNNTLEDMKSVENIVKTHKIHPTLGIVLPGSVNPEYQDLKDPYFPPPTDKNSPLKGPRPHTIIQQNSDGTKTVSKIPRSWARQVNEDFENVKLRKKVADVLKAVDLAKAERCSLDLSSKSVHIDDNLMRAASAALEHIKNSEAKDIKKAYTKDSKVNLKLTSQGSSKTQDVSSTKPLAKTIQRPFRLQYDPVRDSFPESHQDLLDREYCNQKKSRISKLDTRTKNYSKLNELADYALNNPKRSSMMASIQKDLLTPKSSIASITSQSTLPLHSTILQQSFRLSVQPPTNRQPQSIPYQDKKNSLHSINHLISLQPPQNMTQHHRSSNEGMMPQICHSTRIFAHQPPKNPVYPQIPASQTTYSNQLPPQQNFYPHHLLPVSSFNSNPPTTENHVSPYNDVSFNPISSINRPLATINYNPQSSTQAIHSPQSFPPPIQLQTVSESNNCSELRHNILHQNISASASNPLVYSWRAGVNFHPFAHQR